MNRRINSWGRHYQSVWEERAADNRLPDWLRIACLAYGKHRANGHANLGRGSLALVLAKVDAETGQVKKPDPANIRRALHTAVYSGWLAQGSTTTCLIVPGHAIAGGLGNPLDECPLQERHRRAEVTAKGVLDRYERRRELRLVVPE